VRRNLVTEILIILLLIGISTFAFEIRQVKASGTILIRADGSIEPATANITTSDHITYTFTDDNYDSIVIERDNIAIDGGFNTVRGKGSGVGIALSQRNNVTIKNMQITEFATGCRLASSENCIIIQNSITKNDNALLVESASHSNFILENEISNNTLIGIKIRDSNENIITGNNITNNRFGFHIWESLNNTVSGNKVLSNHYEGLYLFHSTNNVLRGNFIAGNSWNFGIWGMTLLHFINDIDASNIVEENPILYYTNARNLTISPQTNPNIGY